MRGEKSSKPQNSHETQALQIGENRMHDRMLLFSIGKRGLTRSFLQWTFLCLTITVLASSAAFLGAKISKRLWRYIYAL